MFFNIIIVNLKQLYAFNGYNYSKYIRILLYFDPVCKLALKHMLKTKRDRERERRGKRQREKGKRGRQYI